MKKKILSFPEIGLIAGTRVALGAGIGILISNYLGKRQRKTTGLALLGVGVLSTVPIAMRVLGKNF